MKMKKNYITPQIAVFTCNSESLLAGLSGGTTKSNVGTSIEGPVGTGETGGAADLSKSNSGLLDWDDEEE